LANTYDVAVVGGRCAGSALATYLARAGATVAVLEADDLGTDQVISTHTVHPAGMDILDELGVGEAVRREAPPATRIRFEVDGAYVDVEPPPGRFECCPRRFRLDGLLQAAAEKSGAEMFARTRVTQLLWDGERVTGVRARHNSQEFEVRARVTVGADGRRSTVAALAGAEEYLAYDSPRAMYWAYWRPPELWRSSAYPFDFLLRFAGDDRRVIFSTDNGELLLGTLPPLAVARGWRGGLDAGYLQDLRRDPLLGPLVASGTRTSKVIGSISERFFFRRAAGPGWALVGDAGHHKDPILGWGISEALEQAKKLAVAIQAGGDAALQRYWRTRDVDALPRFRLAEDRGALGPLNGVLPVVLRHAKDDPALTQQLAREVEFDVNPYELMPAGKVLLWTLAAAVRGRPALIVDLFKQVRRVDGVKRELQAARSRLASAG
jgi:flavin-dependent dehydrogenase